MKSRLPIAGIIVGLLLCAGPMFGMAGTVRAMMKAFDALGRSGPSDPAELSGAIGQSLVSTAIGLGVGVLGVLILITSLIMLILSRRRTATNSPLTTNVIDSGDKLR